MKVEFYETIKQQIELLPRLTIIYSKECECNGFAIEWLFFGVYVNLKTNKL